MTEPADYNKYTVVFQDWDGTELASRLVVPGQDAEAPNDPKREGYVFIGWDRDITNIQESFTTRAQYTEIPENSFVVRFIGMTDEVIYTAIVKYGEDAPPVAAPTVEGYTFTGWRPGTTNITKDTDIYAQYVRAGSVDDPNNPGGNPANPSPTPGGGNSGNNGDDNNNGGDGTTTAKTYTLTVRNGSGSGSYVAGSQPIIIANDPASGQEFSNWTIDPENTTIASRVLTATVITMPEGNVTVTAHYKAKGSDSSVTTGSGNSSSNNSSNRRPTTSTSSVNKGGTTVVIDKNGLSNTGVVSATVNGSSDNFTIKVSESSAASEAAVKALMAEYGDLNNIKYFPMDISLYDSTGQRKITDTTGLSISITLPLPDALATYAGNNKVASVVNDRLEKLTPKFTTISGVPCITFTAEHFSPYVIYVDTGNLSASAMADNTPKTGDGIHPKWFLSIGLGCLSMVFFMKKDKKTLKKKLVKA